jgi:hypothetical protein
MQLELPETLAQKVDRYARTLGISAEELVVRAVGSYVGAPPCPHPEDMRNVSQIPQCLVCGEFIGTGNL